MYNFTFNLLDRFGVLEKVYTFFANLVNKHVLSRHNFDTEYIADVFNAIDGFWLKYGRSKWYNESEIRVIVGSVVESLRDNQLTEPEVRALTNFVITKWRPDVAHSKKNVSLPLVIEDNIFKSVELYSKINNPPKPETFVAKTAALVSKDLADGDIVKSLLGIFR